MFDLREPESAFLKSIKNRGELFIFFSYFSTLMLFNPIFQKGYISCAIGKITST